MKQTKLFGFLTILATTVALAQPPEEVPPPLPETTEQVAPASSAPITFAPVAEPKLAAPAAPEDKRMKGVEISPSVRLVPFGYDSINIGGPEGSRSYFGLKPTLGISTSFKTATDKTVDLSMEFYSEWREYYTKNGTSRDFDTDVSGEVSVKWSDLISTSVGGEFEYFFKAGNDSNQDNGIIVNILPTMKFTVSKELGFKIGYEFWLIDNINSPIGPDGQFIYSDPASDADEFRRGGFTSDATGFDNFNPGGVDEFGNPISLAGTQNQYFLDNRIAFGTTYKFSTGTSVGFEYKYRFAMPSNDEAASSNAHYFIPSVSQALPWKGGKIALKDELRMQESIYAEVDSANFPGVKKQDFRNRLTLTASQEINDYMDAELYYRYQLKGKNADDYAKLTTNNFFYIGLNFKF